MGWRSCPKWGTPPCRGTCGPTCKPARSCLGNPLDCPCRTRTCQTGRRGTEFRSTPGLSRIFPSGVLCRLAIFLIHYYYGTMNPSPHHPLTSLAAPPSGRSWSCPLSRQRRTPPHLQSRNLQGRNVGLHTHNMTSHPISPEVSLHLWHRPPSQNDPP